MFVYVHVDFFVLFALVLQSSGDDMHDCRLLTNAYFPLDLMEGRTDEYGTVDGSKQDRKALKIAI